MEAFSVSSDSEGKSWFAEMVRAAWGSLVWSCSQHHGYGKEKDRHLVIAGLLVSCLGTWAICLPLGGLGKWGSQSCEKNCLMFNSDLVVRETDVQFWSSLLLALTVRCSFELRLQAFLSIAYWQWVWSGKSVSTLLNALHWFSVAWDLNSIVSLVLI